MLEKAAQRAMPLVSARKELRSLVVDPIVPGALAAIRAMFEVLFLFGGYRIVGRAAVRLVLVVAQLVRAAVRLALAAAAHMIADRGGQHAGRTLSVVSLVDYPNKRDQEFLP